MKSRIWCQPFGAPDRRWRYTVRVVTDTGLSLIGGSAPTWDQALGRVHDLHRAARFTPARVKWTRTTVFPW